MISMFPHIKKIHDFVQKIHDKFFEEADAKYYGRVLLYGWDGTQFRKVLVDANGKLVTTF